MGEPARHFSCLTPCPNCDDYSANRSCHAPSAPFFAVQRTRSVTIRERLSERLLKLLKHLRLGFEKLVIIPLRQNQCRFIRLLNDPDTVIRRKGGNELYRFFDVSGLASEG